VHRLEQLRHLAFGEVAPRTGRQAAHVEGADTRPRQAQRRVADVVQHPPYDSVPALVDHDPQQGAALLGPHRTHLIGYHALTLDRDAHAQALQHFRGRVPVEQGLVLLLELVARMGHAEGEVAVVGQQ